LLDNGGQAAQLGHHGTGIGEAYLGALPGEPDTGGNRQVPVDHLCAHTSYRTCCARSLSHSVLPGYVQPQAARAVAAESIALAAVWSIPAPGSCGAMIAKISSLPLRS